MSSFPTTRTWRGVGVCARRAFAFSTTVISSVTGNMVPETAVWNAQFLQFAVEKRLPMTKVFQQWLVVHVAGGLLLANRCTNLANQLNGGALRARHPWPQSLLIEDFRDCLAQSWSLQV